MDKTEETGLKTPYMLAKEAREYAIYCEYMEEKAKPGAMTTQIYKMLMEKYSIFSTGTVWNIIRRVGLRIGGPTK